MIKEMKIEMTLEHGPKLEITYKYTILSDSGEWMLVCWEPNPQKEVPSDLIIYRLVGSEIHADKEVENALKRAMSDLSSGFMITRCRNCEE